jgi:hypothetical protein
MDFVVDHMRFLLWLVLALVPVLFVVLEVHSEHQ